MSRRAKFDCYEYVRSYYGVPAHVGGLVRVRGQLGKIVEATTHQHYVHIRLYGEEHSRVYHPTDGIEYLAGKEPH